jgi:F-type H+-transporting ATPase subunit b
VAEAARAEAAAANERATRAEQEEARWHDAADAHATDAEQGVQDLELRVAEATASAQAFKSQASEATRRAEAAEARAEAEIATVRSEAAAAVERARAEAVDAVRRATRPIGGEAAGGDPVSELDADEVEELRHEVRRLRSDQLETVGRMHDAERRVAELEAAGGRGSSETAEAPADEDDRGVHGPAPERSLRSRLAESATRKRGVPAPESDAGR